jgi:catechol 2,3-dioxygenase-like lactoylglutathione lyase family enzyme
MTTTETTIGINGMAHVILTVSQFAAARASYGRLLPALGMTPVWDTDKLFYCVGARTAIGIQPAGPAHDGDRFVQSRVGWHHLCLCEPVRAKTWIACMICFGRARGNLFR